MARKRAHGEGSLRQRPNGIWELTLMVGFQSDGRRKYKSFYAKTQKEVKEKAKAYQSAKAEGLDVDTVYYFSDWADMWFENHKDNIMPTTQESFQYTLRILKANFPRKKLKDIKPIDVETAADIPMSARCKRWVWTWLPSRVSSDMPISA